MNSINKGLKHINGDIILLCDDDLIYNDNYEKDIIVFNRNSPNRSIKHNKKNKRLNFYNVLRYESSRIAFRKESAENII